MLVAENAARTEDDANAIGLDQNQIAHAAVTLPTFTACDGWQ